MSRKESVVNIDGFEVTTIETEDKDINPYRSVIYFFKTYRFIELSQSTEVDRLVKVFVWRKSDVIPAHRYLNTHELRSAFLAVVKHALETAEKWDAERAGVVVFPEQQAAQ